jgi:hypothetical protein
MGRNAGECRSAWRFHGRNAVPAIYKVMDLALCCSRHKIAVKCTKMQEFACNFEKFLGVATPAAGGATRSRTHPQYGQRPYAGAAPQSYRSRYKKYPIYTPGMIPASMPAPKQSINIGTGNRSSYNCMTPARRQIVGQMCM